MMSHGVGGGRVELKYARETGPKNDVEAWKLPYQHRHPTGDARAGGAEGRVLRHVVL